MKLKILSILILISFHAFSQEVNYVKQPFDSIQNKEIRGLFEDSKNNVWLSTKGQGIYRTKGKKAYKMEITNSKASNGFISSLEDGKDLWFAARGVIKLNGKTSESLNKEKIKSTVVFSISKDDSELIYFSGNRGVDVLDKGKWNHYNTTSGLKHQVVHDTKKDRNGNLWFATRKGGLNMLGKNNEWEYFLPNHNCRKLFETKDGNIWIGTSSGAVLLNTSSKTTVEFNKGLSLMPQIEMEDGTVLFTSEGGGLYTYDGNTWENFTTKNSSLKSNIIHAAILTKKNKIWLGLAKGYQVIKPKLIK